MRAAAHGLNYVILRYFNVAGADPKQRTGQSTVGATHLIKVAVETALGMRPQIEVFGTDYPTPDGTCIRDYIHVSDLVTAHCEALRHLRSGAPSLTLNCGYGHGFSVREVIDAVKRVSGVDFAVETAPRRAGDPAQIVADSGQIRKTLGNGSRVSTIWQRSSVTRLRGKAASPNGVADRRARASNWRACHGCVRCCGGSGVVPAAPSFCLNIPRLPGKRRRRLPVPPTMTGSGAKWIANEIFSGLILRKVPSIYPLLRRLLVDEALGHWPRYASAMAMMVIIAGCTALSAYLLGTMINAAYVNKNYHQIVALGVLAMAHLRGQGACHLRVRQSGCLGSATASSPTIKSACSTSCCRKTSAISRTGILRNSSSVCPPAQRPSAKQLIC